MSAEEIRGGVIPLNLAVMYQFSWATLEAAVRALFGSDATLELDPSEQAGSSLSVHAGELTGDDATFNHLRVLLTYQHEQLHLRHLTGSPVGLTLYLLGGRQYAAMAAQLQAFGQRIGGDNSIEPVMPFARTHGNEPEISAINETQSMSALYHALVMGDMSSMTLSAARADVLPSLFAELELLCSNAFGADASYPPIDLAGADDQPCSIGSITGEAVLEGLARTNEYLMAVMMGAPLPVLNRYVATKHHGVYAATSSLVEELLDLTAPSSWPVVATLSDWALQAPVLPFLLTGRAVVALPELLPAWRFFLLVSRWHQIGIDAEDLNDAATEAALFESLGWEPPTRVAERVLALKINRPASVLTRVYFENLQAAAEIRLSDPRVLAFPASGDAGHRLQAVYNIFTDGMRPGTSGRFASDDDAWQIPYLLIDDSVVDMLLQDEHLGRSLTIARWVSDFLTNGAKSAGTLVGSALIRVLGQAAALRLLKNTPTSERESHEVVGFEV
jgi:hypothetical protein